MKNFVLALLVSFFGFAACPVMAQTLFHECMDDWPLDLKIEGTVMACSDETLDEEQFKVFLEAAGGDEAVIVSIGFDGAFANSNAEDWLGGAGVSHFQISETDPQDEDSDGENDLASAMSTATGVWLPALEPLNLEQKQFVKRLAPELAGLVNRGGVVFTTGSISQMLGKYQITGGQFLGNANHASMASGLNLIPDTVLQVNYKQDRGRRRLMSVIGSHPRAIGIGMDSGTTLILRGRKIRALGEGELHFFTMANERNPLRRKSIAESESRRANSYESMVDLTAWRRDAIDRTLDIFPPTAPETPHVENGTLLIIGGGGLPDGMMDQFVELAGGTEAHLVYIPCTEREELSQRDSRMVEAWREQGVASAHVVHTKDRNQANSDDEFLEPLKNATGIFFGGGRQWNFADSYYGTEAHRLMKDVLNRGGVIAGSSAGASIQARYLARANPLGNIDIMAPGYERGGLGFISGVAIDQHFTQRGRQADMSSLVNRYPQILGIGIDERTAIVVQKSIATIVGAGDVYFYNRGQHAAHDEPDYLSLGDGKKYDLAKREVVDE